MKSQPAIALLSNGSYNVMITPAGAGYSTWRDLDITRWREDATRDCWGAVLLPSRPQRRKPVVDWHPTVAEDR